MPIEGSYNYGNGEIEVWVRGDEIVLRMGIGEADALAGILDTRGMSDGDSGWTETAQSIWDAIQAVRR
jgi:hypothetical protein